MLEPLFFVKPEASLAENGKNVSFKEGSEDKFVDSTATTTPRSIVIVPRSKSPAACRRVTPASISTAVDTLEKRLPNGDLYMGTFSNSIPHGSGKYLWKDGCMYEGEWKKGKATGKGKFSWPSGATFEGEFKSGRMEGMGTFIGSDGEMYNGSWSADRKHGYGVKKCANGDYYEGQWKRDMQDGQGRYVWMNGNVYAGGWKAGMIHGGGVLIWKNGNKYAGNWENGIPKEHGVFTWPDGSCYIVSWPADSRKKGVQNQILNGTFYPSLLENKGFEDGLKEYIGDAAVIGGRKKWSSFLAKEGLGRTIPNICIWDSDGAAGDITCDIISDRLAIDRAGFKQFKKNPCVLNEEVKKPGQTVAKGHKNYDLMLNLQLGIRHSVGKHASVLHDLKPCDFDPNEKFWTRFPAEGSKTTPSHNSVDFWWKDYCPVVFRHLRELFEVDPADYMLAVCGNEALRELSSPGKSGSFFYVTQDDRFMIKTVKKSEAKVLIKMLSSYYQHVSCYENSLLTKFFGIHCVKPVGGIKTRFVVMGNMFCSAYKIHRRFDLKGSSHGRVTDKPKEEIDETTTLKDLDLNFVFKLQTDWYTKLIEQINHDCEFLEAARIMDYSLLVGLHFHDDSTGDKIGLSPFLSHSGKVGSFQNEKFMRGCRFLEAELQDMDRIMSGRKPLIRLGSNMPARAQRVVRKSDFDQYSSNGFNRLTIRHSGETYKVVLYFGIIDILQDYDISKKLEHAYKSIQFDATSISAVDPKLYSKRFRDFVGKIFVEER